MASNLGSTTAPSDNMDSPSDTMDFIYVIGAQCTGKTSLTTALMEYFEHMYPATTIRLLNETAHATMTKHGYTREDVGNGGERCLELQRLIATQQLDREDYLAEVLADEVEPDYIVVCDRSGFDPVVYAEQYCGPDLASELKVKIMWQNVVGRMKKGVVVVCEPVKEWLVDDGFRYMPKDEEWMATHQHFVRLLEENDITYTILPSSVKDMAARVVFVVRYFEEVTGGWVKQGEKAEEKKGKEEELEEKHEEEVEDAEQKAEQKAEEKKEKKEKTEEMRNENQEVKTEKDDE